MFESEELEGGATAEEQVDAIATEGESEMGGSGESWLDGKGCSGVIGSLVGDVNSLLSIVDTVD